jgi:hypothetical protein
MYFPQESFSNYKQVDRTRFFFKRPFLTSNIFRNEAKKREHLKNKYALHAHPADASQIV